MIKLALAPNLTGTVETVTLLRDFVKTISVNLEPTMHAPTAIVTKNLSGK